MASVTWSRRWQVVCLYVIMIHVSLIGQSGATNCYKCDTATSTTCNDPFSTFSQKTCTQTDSSCAKFAGTYNGYPMLIRYCAGTFVDSCAYYNSSGLIGTVCYCSTDNCNTGSKIGAIGCFSRCSYLITMVTVVYMMVSGLSSARSH